MVSFLALVLAFLATPLSVSGASPIAAEVNGQVITKREVDAAFAPILRQLEKRFKGEELEKKKKEFYSRTLEELIKHRLLVQTAKDLEVTVDEKAVDAHLDQLAARVGGWPHLLDILRRGGISLDDKIRQVREGELVKRLLSAVILPRIYTSPADLRRYYEEHAGEFTEPAKYRVGQIILGKKNDEEAARNRKKLEEIKAELERGGDFAELAGKHSIGPHRDKGGDWGFLRREDLVKGLRDALSGMKVGEVKGPVETKSFLHLVKVTDIERPELKPFPEVQETIKMMLRKQAYVTETQKYVDDLRRRAHIRIVEGR
jgi:parvulin-like peptidyl-prolyl isomerase